MGCLRIEWDLAWIYTFRGGGLFLTPEFPDFITPGLFA